MPDHSRGRSADLEHAAAVFTGARPRLFGIAYRILGSVAEAEDVVQDAWLRWQAYDRSTVLDPPAFLATTATRLAINVAQSARVRRETYVGPWLPDPVDTSADPTLGAERGEALETAVLLLLETLTPTERAAYVLREAFGYAYREIGDVLEREEANVRQLVSRARRHVDSGRREAVSDAQRRRLLDAFLEAAQAGELRALEELFAADVVSLSDGGGFARAARTPLVGRERVARFVAAVASHFWTGVVLTHLEANGQPAVLVSREDKPVALLALGTSADGIDHLFWMMNPHKLTDVS